jgi:hypothetical protein
LRVRVRADGESDSEWRVGGAAAVEMEKKVVVKPGVQVVAAPRLGLEVCGGGGLIADGCRGGRGRGRW